MGDINPKSLFLKLAIPYLASVIASIVFLIALIDFFVTSAALFANPGNVMLFAAGVAIASVIIIGVVMFSTVFGDKTPRRNKWQ